MRPEQLSVANIAKAFRLIEETIILVSDRETVAIPEGGMFYDVDYLVSWTVQGDKATGPRFGGPAAASKWKPQFYPPPIRATSASTSGSSSLPSSSRQVRKQTSEVPLEVGVHGCSISYVRSSITFSEACTSEKGYVCSCC